MAPVGCPLSERQLEVFRLMAQRGLRSKGVVRHLHLSCSTVRQHMSDAYRKLGVNNLPQALTVCWNAGWLDPTGTRVQRPTRYPDRTVTDEQRVYLKAFDKHLVAGENKDALVEAKRRTDAAAVACDMPARSSPSRAWMDGLLSVVARVG